ncbi:extracellular solute-binding protein [Paenibacillus eucommiae]|uniref:Aldouronate transport system substrate-binding protein n=1 Tax=Paenibacillus eucommiae TaxID=1355755 RepID=A0ABS4J1M7_9BACL|nr:extracellular solute-binding protein [Paenibacillus eucommiae]MBP1993744.1 putative aldouronate transport system substrate-binding protein [Paenibacillus eucommiae]
MKHGARSRSLKKAVMLVVLSTLVLLAACSSGDKKVNEQPGASEKPVTTVKPAAISPEGKFDPPIEITTGRSTEGMKFEEGRSIDNNQYYDAYLAQLGIGVKNAWVVSNLEGYINKMNVAVASGEIPELAVVSGAQLKRLVEADMIEDLSAAYEQYASENTKAMMTADGGNAMRASTYGGKLYALPITSSSVDSAGVLWIREDWLKKLNLTPPETMEDVVKIAKAFVDSDPSGKTIGIGMSKELNYMGSPNIGNLLNGFHAFPGSWVKDSSGKLVYGSTLPEMKPGLAKLAEMFKNGLMDKEFGVKDLSKVFETMSAGKLGLFFGDMAAPLYANNGSKKNDPNAEWKAYPIPSIDGAPIKVQVGGLSDQYHVIKKGYAHPQALVLLMNFWIEKNWYNPEPGLSRNVDTGILYYPYAIVTASPAEKNLNDHRAIAAALASGDDSKLDTDQKFYYGKIKKWQEKKDDVADWGYDRVFGSGNSSLEIIDNYTKSDMLNMTAFLGGSTPAMVEKMASLEKMEKVMITKIILGTAGLEEFDKFVSDWYKQGGEQITKEVNEWADAVK